MGSINALLLILSAGAAFLGGIASFYFLLKYRVVIDNSHEKLMVELPVFGKIRTNWSCQHDGLFVEEVKKTLDKIRRFRRLLDFDLMLEYTEKYGVHYVGMRGDDKDGSWRPGSLAYSTIHGGYSVFLNPQLHTESLSTHLSKQLHLEMEPQDVYPFLFLHEIGHSTQSGNECYISACVNHVLAGRRGELKEIRSGVEKYADNFAIKELFHWKQRVCHRNPRKASS